MALFKISQGNSSNLPTNYHNGYCYFTIDEGKLYIDFPGTGEDQQAVDNEILIRRPLNANRADFVGHRLDISFNGTYSTYYNGDRTVLLDITPELIGALSKTDNYAASLSPNGAALSANKLNTDAGSSVRPVYFKNGIPYTVSNNLDINAASADKINHWLKIQFNGTDIVQFDGSNENKTVNITPAVIGALATTTLYAGSASVGGPATSAVKLTAGAGDAIHPIYIAADGTPTVVSGTQAINVASADKVNHSLKIDLDGTTAVTYDGDVENKTVDITPESINAVRRNGDTIPGPLTLNGVFTVNNDAYIDSTTVGDLLVNGGTRFVGDVNAGKITASSFVGPLTGNATSADKVNHYISIQINGTEKAHYDGSTNQSVNLTAESLGLLGNTTLYALGDAVGGNAVAANKLTVNAGSSTRPVYFSAGVPVAISNTDEIDLIAKSANSLNAYLSFQINGTEEWRFNGAENRILNLSAESLHVLSDQTYYAASSTVGGAAISADRLTVDAGSSEEPVYFRNGIPYKTSHNLNINAMTANAVNNNFNLYLDGTYRWGYNGSITREIDITPESINALRTNAKYAGSNETGGAANSANKLNTNAGDVTHPVYFANGVPVQVTGTQAINVASADKVNYSLAIALDGTNAVTYDGSTTNKSVDITPESINAVRRNGDTIPGPLTLNGVFTVNNDAYIDSATVGDLLVNGGTRFVGDVNAGKITANSFVGPLIGNATSADKVNHYISIQINGTEKVHYDGSANQSVNLTPDSLGLLGATTKYALGDAAGGNAVKANALNVSAAIGSTTRPVYIPATGVPAVISNTAEIDLIAKQANSVKENFILEINGSELWRYNGSAQKSLDLTPELIGALSKTDNYAAAVTPNGAALSANKLNTDAGNSTKPVYFRNGIPYVVSDNLAVNTRSADKVNHWLKIQLNGTDAAQYDGSIENKTVNITASNIGALGSNVLYAGSATQGGSATSAVKLDSNAGSDQLPIYFTEGKPAAISTSKTIDIIVKQANKTTYNLKIAADGTNQITFDGSTQNKSIDITPELINAVRRNGDIIPGPLTLNGVFTVNNDAYIDSATIGDLLVNGGTRFVSDVNAGKITASSFIGPLTGNATSADKVNHYISFQLDGTEQWQFNGENNCIINLNNAILHSMPDTTTYAASNTIGGSALAAERLTVDAGNSTLPVYFRNGIPYPVSQNLNINSATANKVNNVLTIELNGTAQDPYDGSAARRINITAANVGAITKLGDTDIGALAFKNDNVGISRVGRSVSWHKGRDSALVKTTSITGYGALASIKTNNGSWDIGAYNNSSYADDLLFTYVTDTQYNGSTAASTAQIKFLENGHIVATLDGNASTADKVNHALNLEFDGDALDPFDGSAVRTFDITPEAINAVRRNGDTIPGPLTLNGVMTINNDAYIDSATIGDLLVNGGTRFVGDVNAGKITASSFVGPLTGNATSADKVNHSLTIEFNGTNQATFDGSGSSNQTVNITPNAIAAAPKVNGVYYGTCDTAQATQAKVVTLVNGTGFALTTGALVAVKFTNASAASTMTMNVGGTGAKNLCMYGSTAMSSGTVTDGWSAGAVVLFVYDGTQWERTYWYNSTYTVGGLVSWSNADSSLKYSGNASGYAANPGNLFEVTLAVSNTYAGPLTFQVNSVAAKPIWINGHPSSETNHTLPAGKYMVYYDGSRYLFDTKGYVPGPNHVHTITVGNPTVGSSGTDSYFKFAEFHVTGDFLNGNNTFTYMGSYRIKSINTGSLSYNHTFNLYVTFTSDADKAATISNIELTYPNGYSYYSTGIIRYCYTTDRKNLELYFRSYSTNGYQADIELIEVNQVFSTANYRDKYNIAYFSGTGYTLDFLQLNNSTTSSTVIGSTIYQGTNYGYAGYAANAYSIWDNAQSGGTTTKYYLGGFGVLSTDTPSAGWHKHYFSPNIYYLNNELYASLHANKLFGTSGTSYGATLPTSPTTGQIFFQTGGSSSSSGGLGLPTGGSSGQQLYKNSATDGDVSWSNPNQQNTSATTVYVTGCTSATSKQQYHSSIYMNCSTGVLMGAAWNDYAEYREADTTEPGRCVVENGDDTLSLSTERMQPGAEIISDTFGFAIGKNGRSDTPIAATGRVLAYPYEDRNEFKPGMPVCSGPNGTVSIMTKEEARENPWCIIGTVSAVPNYDTWGEANVKVNGRVWIRIR